MFVVIGLNTIFVKGYYNDVILRILEQIARC